MTHLSPFVTWLVLFAVCALVLVAGYGILWVFDKFGKLFNQDRSELDDNDYIL